MFVKSPTTNHSIYIGILCGHGSSMSILVFRLGRKGEWRVVQDDAEEVSTPSSSSASPISVAKPAVVVPTRRHRCKATC